MTVDEIYFRALADSERALGEARRTAVRWRLILILRGIIVQRWQTAARALLGSTYR